MGTEFAMALSIIDANQTNGDNEPSKDEENDFEKSCKKVSMVILGMISVVQIVTTSLFLIQSRNLKEIKRLPKAIIIMATMSIVN